MDLEQSSGKNVIQPTREPRFMSAATATESRTIQSGPQTNSHSIE